MRDDDNSLSSGDDIVDSSESANGAISSGDMPEAVQVIREWAEKEKAVQRVPDDVWLSLWEFMETEGLARNGNTHGAKETVAAMRGMLLKFCAYLAANPNELNIYAAFRVLNDRAIDSVYGFMDQSQMAKKLGVEKATVCAAVKRARAYLKSPLRGDQRKDQAKENMRNSRLKQLKATTT